MTRYECTRCQGSLPWEGVHHDADSKIGKAHAKYGQPIVSFAEMTPVQHLERATKMMGWMTAAGSWTPETLYPIGVAIGELTVAVDKLRKDKA